jgi:ribokinase
MLDPAPAQPLPEQLLKSVDWFTPNQTEAEFYSDYANSTEEILSRLFAKGIRNVVLKRGEEGSLIADVDGGREWTSAFPVSAVDTTAAGDAFNGAFAVALMRKLPLAECGRFASAAAAISVTRCGAQPSLPTETEVSTFMSVHSQVG